MKQINAFKSSIGQAKNWIIIPCLLLFGLVDSYGQTGILKGIVVDGITRRTLQGVTILNERTGRPLATTAADGTYLILLATGDYTVEYRAEGFQVKIITELVIRKQQYSFLSVLLYPINKIQSKPAIKSSNSSLRQVPDSVVRTSYLSEYAAGFAAREFLRYDDGLYLQQGTVTPGNYKNGAMVVNGIPGVVQQNYPLSPGLQTLTVSGMGERYQQLQYNGAVLNYFDPLQRTYPLGLLPTEAIETAGVQKTFDGQLPADFAGGSLSVTTKDHADFDFFYVRMGAGSSMFNSENKFYHEKRGRLEFLGMSGSQRSLPAEFPTTRSQFPLSAKNIQEQVRLSQLLKNNIAPGKIEKAGPDEKFTVGFGKNYRIKKSGTSISITGYIDQGRQLQFTQSFSQSGPNLAQNPYPFSNTTQPLITSQSTDSNYTYSSHLSAVLNASLIYKRNKISFRNFGGSRFVNTYSTRTGIYKPDEDTLAHDGIHIGTTQQYFLNSQLAGVHVLGETNQLKLDWQVTYSYQNTQYPDERNLLLRKDATGKLLYELATPLTDGEFTNSGRLWRQSKDNGYSANVNLGFPFRLLQQVQFLSGGIAVQQHYRRFNSDLLFTQGTGYTSTDNLLSPERYYPGGVSLSSYYVNGYSNPTVIPPRYRGNYTASTSIGAAYLQLDARLNRTVALRLAARAETDNQLASNIYYNYSVGFRNPQSIALDENTRITSYYFLPAASIVYTPFRKLQLFTSYFKTLNRPQLQELTKYSYYDAQSFLVKTGNPLLATALIKNYNAGIRFRPNPFSVLTVSAFYKNVDQPVEYIVSGYNNGNMLMTPHNTPAANVKGLEASLNIRLNFIQSPWVSGITLFTGANLIRSTAKAGPVRSTETPQVAEHRLSGSPDYTINGGLLFQYDKFPQITVQYNRTGASLLAVGSGIVYTLPNGNRIAAVPDYMIGERDQLDIQLAQKLFHSKLQLIAGVNNITAGTLTTYQDLNGNKKFDGALTLKNTGNSGGYYSGGTDNAVFSIKTRPVYHLTLSYLFN